MADSDQAIAHSELSTSRIDADDVELAGDRSRVYHESSIGSMDSQHDGRLKTLLINEGLVPDAGDLLVDIVTYGPTVSCPVHYHEGTDHFFYVLEGEGVIEIEGEAFPLEKGTVAWVGEGDVHRLYTRGDQRMMVLEYFSNNDHPATRVEGEGHTWRSADRD